MPTSVRRHAIEGILQDFRDWRERQRQRRALAELPRFERDRLYPDLGLRYSELDDVITGAEASRNLLPRMMERYGLNSEAVEAEQPAVMRDLQRTCGACPVQRLCRRTLDSDADVAECRRFCSNSTTLDSLLREPELMN